jgi:hypothetical protein
MEYSYGRYRLNKLTQPTKKDPICKLQWSSSPIHRGMNLRKCFPSALSPIDRFSITRKAGVNHSTNNEIDRHKQEKKTGAAIPTKNLFKSVISH